MGFSTLVGQPPGEPVMKLPEALLVYLEGKSPTAF